MITQIILKTTVIRILVALNLPISQETGGFADMLVSKFDLEYVRD